MINPPTKSAEFMADVILSDITLSDCLTQNCLRVSTSSFLYLEKINPTIMEESKCPKYKKTPKLTLLKQSPPTTLITKEGEEVAQRQEALSASVAEMRFCFLNSAIIILPIG